MFTGVCRSLPDMGLGKCRIHLDGASYHFRKASSKPTGNRKAEWIQRKKNVKNWLAKDSTKRWLEQKDVSPKGTRIDRRGQYTTFAKKNRNHVIHKTTSPYHYHCELQPIEKVWACCQKHGRGEFNRTDVPISPKSSQKQNLIILKRKSIHSYSIVIE